VLQDGHVWWMFTTSSCINRTNPFSSSVVPTLSTMPDVPNASTVLDDDVCFVSQIDCGGALTLNHTCQPGKQPKWTY